MEEQEIIWTKTAKSQLFAIMDYYAKRNKSDTYSLKLANNIKEKLKSLDFNIALPQKTVVENLFYFTVNHISTFFSIQNTTITVKFVIDERRNPKRIKKLISEF